MARKRSVGKKKFQRRDLLPGQYRKRSTVFVERLRRPDEPKRYDQDDMYTTDAYIVITNRLDGQWSHSVELKGELPGKVVDRIIQHRQAINKEQQVDNGRALAERQAQRRQEDEEQAGLGAGRPEGADVAAEHLG